MSQPDDSGNTYQKWHLLVFMAADNSLYSNALVSLRELTQGNLQNKVRITVQFEGPTSDDTARYSCEAGTRKMILPAPKGDRAKPAERLSDFLNNAPVKPGERIFLILWGHGSGIDYIYLYSDPKLPNPASFNAAATGESASLRQAALSIPVDVINPNTENANRYVKDIQLGTILGKFSGNDNTSAEDLPRVGLSPRKLPNDKLGKRKIDILGFDSCLMGMAEICHEVSKSVDFVIASDEEIPKGSFPYGLILEDLTNKPDMEAPELSVKIVERFMERYSKESEQTRISLSAYRLERSGDLAIAIKAFVDEVFRDIDKVRSRVLLARNFSRTPEVPDYIDLGIFCNEIMLSFDPSENLYTCAQSIRNVLLQTETKKYILHHKDKGPEGGIAAATGLAVYFPQAIPPITSDSIQQVVDSQTVQHLSQYVPPDKGMKHTPGDTRKTLLVFTTRPSDPNKIPTLDRTKDLDVELVQRQLIGSEVLWCDYTKLSFNSDPESGTGWAEMVEELITGKSDETMKCMQS